MKLDRLFGILAILLEKERVNAKELAATFEVSERTIYRDIAALETAGIPVVTFQGTGGGIGIMSGYKLDKKLLSRKDMAAIGAALHGLSSIGEDRSLKDLLVKLMPAGNGAVNAESDIIIDFSSWDPTDLLRQRIDFLRKAIAEHRCLYLDYFSSSGHLVRMVEPHKIIFKAKSWYLYAYCLYREAFRLFKLSRIRDVSLADKEFAPRPYRPETMPEWGENTKDQKGEKVRLIFEKRQEYLVIDLFGIDNYRKLEDGRLESVFYTPDMFSTLYMVLSFGPDVEVAEPETLKSMLVAHAKDIIRRYES